MQRSNKSMMDYMSKSMEQSTNIWNSYTQNMQNMWKGQMSAAQTMTDAQNITSTRIQDEMKSMESSWTDMWQKNMGSSYNESMSNMMNWMCKSYCQAAENCCDMSQTMNKSTCEAQNGMKNSFQDCMKNMTKEYQNWMKSDLMAGMTSTKPWQEMMTETSSMWPTNATEMMQNSTNWWSNMANSATKTTATPKATSATVTASKSKSAETKTNASASTSA